MISFVSNESQTLENMKSLGLVISQELWLKYARKVCSLVGNESQGMVIVQIIKRGLKNPSMPPMQENKIYVDEQKILTIHRRLENDDEDNQS